MTRTSDTKDGLKGLGLVLRNLAVWYFKWCWCLWPGRRWCQRRSHRVQDIGISLIRVSMALVLMARTALVSKIAS
jgi:hypothetical protein